MKYLYILITLYYFGNNIAYSQNRSSVWCFGDSALVDFSDTSNIITGKSAVKSRGSCASISDSSGTLLLYCFTRALIAGNTTLVKNSSDSLILYGDSIVGEGWYHETVILPDPSNNNFYYIFSIGVTGSSQKGAYYSIVDISANNGLGAVVQKNIQLQNFKAVDCLTAIKHGNGRDWWIFFRKFDNTVLGNNDFYSYLLSPSGISSINIQTVGSFQNTGFGNIAFNKEGTKMNYINFKGLNELYDFDRCTGIISNPVNITTESAPFTPLPQYWSSEFSPSGDLLYVTRIPQAVTDSSRLFQFDLLSPNIAASKDTLWSAPFMITIDQLKKAPDNKIYIATNYYQVYPYTDTTYNYINMNLSVINNPDSLGLACNIQPFSFNLGGKRCYAGLPNNPDYDLGPLTGSICDTLLGVNELSTQSGNFYIYYASNWQSAFINAEKLKGKSYRLNVFDISGKIIFSESGKISSTYYSKNLNCAGFAKGIYLAVLETEKERLVRKFVLE